MGLGGTSGAVSSQPLQITSTGAATFSSSVTATGLNLANTTNGFVGLRLEGTGTYAGSDWTIYASSLSPSSADDFLGFFNNSTTDGATADYKLRIFKNGNVGIGVTPGSTAGITELAIGGSASNPLISGIRDGASAFYIYSDSGGTDFGEKRNLYTRFITNNTERMRITSVGNLEMRPITFSGVANNATQTVLSNMGKGTWLVSVANDVDSSDGYSAMLWVRTNEIIQMQVFRVDSMVFSYSNQDLRIQNTSGFAATLYVTAIRMAAS
jgi:hypothetical protein